MKSQTFPAFHQEGQRGRFQHPEFENSGFSWNLRSAPHPSSLSMGDPSSAVRNSQGWISGKRTEQAAQGIPKVSTSPAAFGHWSPSQTSQEFSDLFKKETPGELWLS